MQVCGEGARGGMRRKLLKLLYRAALPVESARGGDEVLGVATSYGRSRNDEELRAGDEGLEVAHRIRMAFPAGRALDVDATL